MLGKHVNVSARNKSILQKVLCVFLAFVLLGLMVPHGIASQLNAYANNGAEEQATDNPVVTEEQSTQSEEVTAEDPAPAADPVPNAEYKISAKAGDGYFNKEASTEPWPTNITFDDKIGDTDHYKTIWYNCDTEVEPDTKYKDAITFLETKIASVSGAIVAPNDTSYSKFVLPNDVDPEAVVSKSFDVETVYATNIKINNAASGHGNAKLMQSIDDTEATEVQFGQDIANIKYGSIYKIEEPENAPKTLQVESADGKVYTFSVANDTFWDGFGTEIVSDMKITANHLFTATYNENATVHFVTDPEGAKSDVKIYIMDEAQADYVETTWNDIVVALNSQYYKYTAEDPYSGGLSIADKDFAFKLENPTVGLNHYKFSKWQVSTDGGTTYADVTGTEAPINVGDIYFKAVFEENSALTFSSKPSVAGFDIYTTKATGEPSWTKVSSSIYYDNTYSYYYNSSSNYFIVAHYEDGVLVDDDYYDLQGLTTGYKLGKWTAGDSDVGINPTQIDGNLSIVANLQIALTFVFDPVLTPAVGHVESGSPAQTVTQAYAYPGAPIVPGTGENKDQITIDETIYKAVSDNEAYEFGNWPTTTTVPDAPANFTVTFKKLNSVAFTLSFGPDDPTYTKADVVVTLSVGGGTATPVDWDKTYYFPDTYKYWADATGNLCIGNPAAGQEATINKFEGKAATGKTYILFDKWTMNGENLPLIAAAASLKTDDTNAANINFNVLPKVTFATFSPEGAVPDNTKIVYTTPASDTPVDYTTPLYFPANSTAWYSNGDLKVGTYGQSDTIYTFSALSGGHYQKLDKWKVGDHVIVDLEQETLLMNGEYTATAEYKKINDQKLSGVFKKTYGDMGQIAGSATADIYLADPVTKAQGAKIDCQTFDVDATDGYTLENLPEYCYVWVNGYADGYITENAPDAGFLIETTDNPNGNVSFMSTAYNFISTGFVSQTGKWADKVYGAKVMDTTGLSVSGTGLVAGASGATVTFKVKSGDKICLNDLEVYTGSTAVPQISGSVQLYAGDTPQGDPATLTGTREVHYMFDTVPTGVDKAVVTLAAGTVISRFDLHNDAYTVTFAKDTSVEHVGLGTGTFDGTDDSKITAPMGTYFGCEDIETNSLKFMLGGTTENIVTANPDTGCVFRKWMQNVSVSDKNFITEDITITCRFAKDTVYVKFVKSDSSETTADVVPEGTQTISNDSTFQRESGDAYVSTLYVKGMFDASEKYGTDKSYDLKINPDTEKAYKYKFKKEYPFDALQKGNLINEDNYPGIEESEGALPIAYIIVERDPFAVSVDLGNGRFTPTEASSNLDPIPLAYGGQGEDGAWTSTDNKVWTNTVYEEFDVTKLRQETINKLTWDKVFNVSGFFKGWSWIPTTEHQTEPATAVCALNWNAVYDDAVWLGGTVTDSSTAKTAISGAEIRFTTDSEQGLDPSGAKTLKTTTGTDGKFIRQDNDKTKPGRAIQVYKNSYGQLSAGHETHIQDELNVAPIETTKIDYEFALDKGYTWLATNPEKIQQQNMWVNEYSNKPVSQADGVLVFENNPSISGGVLTTSSSFKNLDGGFDNYPLKSGHQIHIYSNTNLANATWNGLFEEAASYNDGSYDFVVWNSYDHNRVTFDPKDTMEITRIDYYVPWDTYHSIYGQVKTNTDEQPMEDVTVYLPGAVNANKTYDGSEVLSYKTDGEGNYYLVFKDGTSGRVLFTADVLDEDFDITDYSYYLDEKYDLTGSESSDITGDVANPKLLDAIHVTGNVQIQDPTTHQYGPANHADISYSPQQNMSADYDYGWNNDNHGYAFSAENGDYTLKLRKCDETAGFVWFHMVGDDPAYAQDGRKLQKDEVELPHNTNIDGIDGWLDIAGANVKITSDDFGQPEASVDGFEVVSYSNSVEVDRYTVESEIEAKNFFSADGQISTGYDEQSRHVLRYRYDAAGFVMTVRPLLTEGYTYWSFVLTDPEGNSQTLSDDSDVTLEERTDNPYVFTVHATEGADLTASGSSEGHGLWNAKVTITSGSAQETITKELKVPAGTDFTRTFPICANEEVNATDDVIHTEYNFDGEKFNLTLSSYIDGTIPYKEHWELLPVAAEGYEFVGLTMNDVEMIHGEIIELNSQDALNLVAHYNLIPNPSVQTGDDSGNWLWLLGLAVLALAGVAYAASRKQKGIRC